nr:hypothetical protein [Tanacetum cinerariifolium]
MRDEHLDTILATKSDEFIKSSVENFVPNLSESKGEYECDVYACEVFTTFSNILFDADYDFSSSDDQSFYDEDILKEIYSNPLFDEEIIYMKIDLHHFNVESDLIESLLISNSPIISSSSKIDSLFDEFAVELTLPKSIPPGINETIEEDDYDSERDILILEELLSNNSLSLPENESFHFDIPSSSHPPAKPPDGNTRILNVKVMGDISEHKVPMHRLIIMDAPLSPDHAFDFFSVEPVPGLVEAPNNQNGWIEWDVQLGGEIDEPIENPRFDGEVKLDEFMNDDEDVLDEDEEWLMAPVTPPRATVTVSSTYEVRGPSTDTSVAYTLSTMASGVATQPQMIDDLYVRMSNLEYRYEELVKNMVKVSDAKVADSITVGEIHPRVATVEEHCPDSDRWIKSAGTNPTDGTAWSRVAEPVVAD